LDIEIDDAMSSYEVPQPILNSPFDPPAEHWHIVEGEPPERRQGRRKAAASFTNPIPGHAGRRSRHGFR